jgi:DNA polymerase/3'-5' exonuclease PolX
VLFTELPDIIDRLGTPVVGLDEEKLSSLVGIGKNIAKKIREISEKGTFQDGPDPGPRASGWPFPGRHPPRRSSEFGRNRLQGRFWTKTEKLGNLANSSITELNRGSRIKESTKKTEHQKDKTRKVLL